MNQKAHVTCNFKGLLSKVTDSHMHLKSGSSLLSRKPCK